IAKERFNIVSILLPNDWYIAVDPLIIRIQTMICHFVSKNLVETEIGNLRCPFLHNLSTSLTTCARGDGARRCPGTITACNGSLSWTAPHRGVCSPLVGQLGGSAFHPTFPRFPGSLTVIFRLIE